MTNAEWENCRDPGPMLIDPRTELAGSRKVGLFGIACLRPLELCAVFEDWRNAIEVAEATLDHADRIPPLLRYHRNWSPPVAARLVEHAVHGILYSGILRKPPPSYGDLVQRVRDGAWRIVAAQAINLTGVTTPTFDPDDEFDPVLQPAMADIRASQAAILRDIVPHPLRPTEFAPSWRTEAVVGLARGMYESRDFAPVPVLADALEDAGCDHTDVLNHCRGPGPHVRGCWVVDLVLGKT